MTSPTHESHTGRELSLMLEGKKPLAVFDDLLFADGVDDEIEHDFAKYIDQGRFVRHEVQDLWPNAQTIRGRVALGTRLRLYALPDERWRIDAYVLLGKATTGRPWNDSLETFVGLLLGYTEEEIAAWIEHFHTSHGSWGAVPAYLKVSSRDLEKLQRLGFRALPPDLDGETILILSSSLPSNELLTLVQHSKSTSLVRFGIDTKFALKLPFEQASDARIVRLPPDSIADINGNLKGTIEVVQHGTA
jgi:hypothetical protein